MLRQLSQSTASNRRLAPHAPDNGEARAVFPLVYDELRVLARRHLAHERPDHTLGATALVNEAYLRLVAHPSIPWSNRTRLFGAADQAMRRILLDYARKRLRLKRGGGLRRIDLDCVDLAVESDSDTVLFVDEALQHLRDWDPRFAEIVRLRFFAGLSAEETARALGVSPATIHRDWKLTRAWLARELSGA